MKPNELQISSHDEGIDQGMSFSLSLLFPAELEIFQERAELRIAWTIVAPAAPNNQPWASIDHYSLLPYGWIPNDGIEFFMQFMLCLKGRWLELCESGEKTLDQSVSQHGTPAYLGLEFTFG